MSLPSMLNPFYRFMRVHTLESVNSPLAASMTWPTSRQAS